MKILVFEFMVGGGVADQHPLDDTLRVFLRQGHSMFQAVCLDLLDLGHEVVALVDPSLELSIPKLSHRWDVAKECELDSLLLKAAAEADRILLIAPESDHCLERYAALLESFADKLISPDLNFIQATQDKWKCHSILSGQSVPCPSTIRLSDRNPPDLSRWIFPCVAKPIDGAGSEGLRLVESLSELGHLPRPLLLQEFVRGIPASVSVISGPANELEFLEPGRQIFATEPFGTFLRTEYPLTDPLRQRAIALARRCAEALPATRGYFGIDMVLADEPKNDVVIEVNPRLTMSYVFLRDWYRENLASQFPL